MEIVYRSSIGLSGYPDSRKVHSRRISITITFKLSYFWCRAEKSISPAAPPLNDPLSHVEFFILRGEGAEREDPGTTGAVMKAAPLRA